ncbi:uncharacterized protein LOC143815566 isoform X2 [Ranitomeya variabilis]|uniref:uncharacterized protein LOC143815566 isoform X2 n=1 Tax=Ranitomeya variabilis TaxID=490064 RepID=UPI0040570B6F
MGSGSSKPDAPLLTTTTVPTTISTFSTRTTTVCHCTEDCLIELLLAFFGGILVTLILFAVGFCAFKIKEKVNKKSEQSGYRCQNQETSNSVGGQHLETTDENVSYATISFKT